MEQTKMNYKLAASLMKQAKELLNLGMQEAKNDDAWRERFNAIKRLGILSAIDDMVLEIEANAPKEKT